MRRDLRESAGLGSPPAKFTTNVSESLNAAIKRKVGFKKSDWPEFISHMKEYVESQREEVIRSLSGRGQYRLCPDFAHYGVPTQSWIKMTAEQRREVVSAFEKAKLPRRAAPQTGENPYSSTASDTLASEAKTSLSIAAEDSGIISIPLVTLSAMWNKATELFSTQNAITPAPGNDSKAKMVLSRTQNLPHLSGPCPLSFCPSTLLTSALWQATEGYVGKVWSLAVFNIPVTAGSITQAPLLQVSSCQQPLSVSLSAHPVTVSCPCFNMLLKEVVFPILKATF